MKEFFNYFKMGKAQRSGFFALIILILIVELGFYFLSFRENNTPTELTVEEKEWLNSLDKSVENSSRENMKKINYFPFNPNDFSAEDWQKFGFSAKQGNVIIKYRNSLGGNFENLAQIQECFVISYSKFEEMKPYIRLEKTTKNQINSNSKEFSKIEENHSKLKGKLKPFDPNQLDLEGWESLGFSKKQAKVILNYKENYLKGQFFNLEHIKNCFVISEEKFNQLKPFIRLPEKSSKSNVKPELIQGEISEIQVNTLRGEDWHKLGASAEEAKNIVKYKDFIGGFENFKALENCPHINKAVLNQLKNKEVIF